MFYVLAVLSLGFLIVVHEAGHYVVARLCNMRVERFSVGFGPGILKKTSTKTGTTFQLAPIPFGGFVEIRGMNIAEEIDPDDTHAYPNRPAWQRFVTIFAGPATNYLSAIALSFVLFTCHGQDSKWSFYTVADIGANSDAQGKLVKGDRIIAVDGVPLLAEGVYQLADGRVLTPGPTLSERVKAKNGAGVRLTVLRGATVLDFAITPKLVKDESNKDTWRLGISQTATGGVVSVGVLKAAKDSFTYPVVIGTRLLIGVRDIISGKEKADVGGPARIAGEFAKAWKGGPDYGLKLLITLSIWLALFNLFPLPALDGGRLVFLTYELVTRRRANPKIEAMVHMGGIMVLGVVMILVTLKDCHIL